MCCRIRKCKHYTANEKESVGESKIQTETKDLSTAEKMVAAKAAACWTVSWSCGGSTNYCADSGIPISVILDLIWFSDGVYCEN